MSVPLNPPGAIGAEQDRTPASIVDTFWRSIGACIGIWALARIVVFGGGSVIAVALGRHFTYPWRIWDAGWFLYVAHHGYALGTLEHEQSPAFYPLYPGLLRFSSLLIGGNTVVAGVLLAFLLTLAALVLLFVLARDLVGEAAGLRSVAYLSLFPYAFFLQALYSEAAFLTCAVAAFLAAERRRFLPAGVLAGLAMLGRPSGVAVLAGLVVLALRHRQRFDHLLRLAAAPVVFSVFPVILALQGRSPLAFLTAEHGWRTYSAHDPIGTVLAPAQSVYNGARAAWAGTADISQRLVSGTALPPYAIHDLVAFFVLIVFAALSVAAWRKLGSHYGVYCAVSLAIPLVARPAAAPLLSLPRFVLVLFPCFVVLGTLPLRRLAYGALLTISGLGLLGVLYLWIHGGQFVA